MNAQIEGVLERVEARDGDMCDLSFLADGSIDVVVASKSIHNIPTHEGRRQAMSEITRVLKPGGRVALMDIFCWRK
ncbi:MAG TPA: class I SAM-dependent methyltransferase [Ktedonobacteraceae bacterium]|jgi:arsenite methyltransferase